MDIVRDFAGAIGEKLTAENFPTLIRALDGFLRGDTAYRARFSFARYPRLNSFCRNYGSWWERVSPWNSPEEFDRSVDAELGF